MSIQPSGPRGESSLASRFIWIAAICGIAGQVVFTFDWIVPGLTESHYDNLRQDVSDFGALTASHPLPYNVMLSLSGALTVVMAVALWRVLGAGLSARIGVIVLAILGGGYFLDGLLREDCAPSGDAACKAAEKAGTLSWHHQAHNIESLVTFAATILAPLILAFAFKSRPRWAALWAYSLATFAVIAVATVWYFVLFFASDGSTYSGVLERVLIEAGAVWIAVVSAWMVLRDDRYRANGEDAARKHPA